MATKSARITWCWQVFSFFLFFFSRKCLYQKKAATSLALVVLSGLCVWPVEASIDLALVRVHSFRKLVLVCVCARALGSVSVFVCVFCLEVITFDLLANSPQISVTAWLNGDVHTTWQRGDVYTSSYQVNAVHTLWNHNTIVKALWR